MREKPSFSDRLTNAAFRGALGLSRVLPYRQRIAFFGWAMRFMVAPIAGLRTRIARNLAHVRPEMAKAEVARLQNRSIDNMGRTIAEIYSGQEFAKRCANLPLQGDGVKALEAARDAGEPIVLITGHIGNYDAMRAALIARGFDVAGLYRPMNNRAFNPHYVEAMASIGPVYPRDRRGLANMVRHLKGGGCAAFVVDQHMGDGQEMTFFGKPAMTSTSPVELAQRYGAQVFPVYGLRRQDGLSFDLVVECPIADASASDMTQSLNDSLEGVMKGHRMAQWMWSHKRWIGNR